MWWMIGIWLVFYRYQLYTCKRNTLTVDNGKHLHKTLLILHKSWWRHQMEICSALLALCVTTFVWGIHRSPRNSPHEGQWRGALMFSLFCAWINISVNNREAGDLRPHRAHYDVIVMQEIKPCPVHSHPNQKQAIITKNPHQLTHTAPWVVSDINLSFPYAWWRYQMETYSALRAICGGNSPVTGEFPARRPVTRSFDVFFDLRPIKRLNEQSRCWWFETPSHLLWRHYNGHVKWASQRPVTWSFDDFFDLCLNKQFSKQSRRWWFETPSRSSWRHCNDKS